MSTTTLTNEDYSALRFSNLKHGAPRVQYQMRTGDDADYRAMLAREESNRVFAGCYERPGQLVTRMAEYACA